jgi:recombination protein RecA
MTPVTLFGLLRQVRSGAMDVVVVDSVAALVPRQEIEGDMGDAHIALQARMMSHGLRKLLASLSLSKSCMIIFLNQVCERHSPLPPP